MANTMYSALGLLLIATVAWANIVRNPGQGSFPKPVSGFPLPGPSFPQPGPSYPIPGPTFPLPGPTFPQPGPTFPLPGPTFPQPGPTFPQPRPQFPFPPVRPPVRPPVFPPVRPPVRPPVFPPVRPPVRPPVFPPVRPPVRPPVFPPVRPPVQPPPIQPPPVIPPVFPPPANCDPCELANTGFANQLGLIEEINDLTEEVRLAAEECNEPRSVPLVDIVEGEPVSGGTSVAACPTGTVVIGCRCEQQAEDQCESVRLIRSNTRCEIRVSDAETNSAIALCSSNDDEEYVFEEGSRDENPVATCPDGSTPVDCWLNKRGDNEATSYLTDINASTGECTSREACGTGSERCTIQLLCRKDA